MCTECPAALATDLMSAFPVLVDHHRDLIYGIARRGTRDHHDAEDLTQEAFLRAFRALRGYPADRRAALQTRPWLARIIVNLTRNAARRGGPPSADLTAIAEPAEDPGREPERLVGDREAAGEWRRRLAALPNEQRLAVELRHVEGLSYPEMSRALGRPVGTVKSDVHRGVARLRRVLEAETASGTRADDPPATRAAAVGAGPAIGEGFTAASGPALVREVVAR